MTRDEYNQLFHKEKLNLVAFKMVNDCDEEILRLVNAAIAKERERILQLIKELRPAIKPLESMGRGKTTSEWFDILVKDIEEKL